MADQEKLARLGHEVAVSVNISGRVLIDPDFADFVDRVMEEAVGKLTFEITEAAVLESPEAALEMIARFRGAGVGVCVDDYGSGMSSLAGLKQVQADELKIDRSLVSAITGSQRDALVLRSAIDLAHGLGLKVTAEGVETANAFQMLAAMGCDNIQGFLIARPMPLAELMSFFAEGRDLRRSFA
jgi:EAL domain-containing protein (putative c-di-GMP-specific phosphodiesterase class I)